MKTSLELSPKLTELIAVYRKNYYHNGRSLRPMSELKITIDIFPKFLSILYFISPIAKLLTLELFEGSLDDRTIEIANLSLIQFSHA